MTIDLARIKEAAEKATKGPWKAFKTPTGLLIGIGEETGEGITDARGGLWGDAEEAVRNADHIVACDPQTILHLVAVVEAARASVNDPPLMTQHLSWHEKYNALVASLQPFTNGGDEMLTCSKCGKFIAHPGAAHVCESVERAVGAEDASNNGDVVGSVRDERGAVGPWTRFMDMHSGGGTKLWRKDDVVSDNGPPWGTTGDFEAVEYIFIEAPQAEAEAIFYTRFGRSPERVSCTCCGSDYSIDESKTLEAASAYERNCAWDEAARGYVEGPRNGREYQTIEQFLARKDVHVIRRADIKPDERTAEIPRQGYVWCD